MKTVKDVIDRIEFIKRNAATLDEKVLNISDEVIRPNNYPLLAEWKAPYIPEDKVEEYETRREDLIEITGMIHDILDDYIDFLTDIKLKEGDTD